MTEISSSTASADSSVSLGSQADSTALTQRIVPEATQRLDGRGSDESTRRLDQTAPLDPTLVESTRRFESTGSAEVSPVADASEDVTAVVRAGEVSEQPAALPTSLWDRMRQDPEFAPEYLALAAVERFGPQAAEWVAEMRRNHPTMTTEELAATVRKRFVSMSRYSGAVAGVAGIAGAVVDVGVLAWNQARMVIYLAAVHGRDPRDRERATELLMLQGVYDLTERARTALEVAAGRAPVRALFTGTGVTRLALKLARMAGMRMIRRGIAKVVPGAAVVFGAMANAGSTKRLADRAIAFYQGRDIELRRAEPGAARQTGS